MSTAEDTQIWQAFYNDKAPSGPKKGKYFLSTRFYCMIPEDIAPDLEAKWTARVEYRTVMKGVEKTVKAKPEKVWQGASGFLSGKARLNVVEIDQEYVSGEILLHIEWNAKDGGALFKLDRKFAAGDILNVHTLVELGNYDAPVLSEQLNSLSPSVVDVGSPTDDEGKVLAIMKHVYAKLERGLGEVWQSFAGIPKGRTGCALSDVEALSELNRQELDECWAQLVAERLALTPYGGPGPNYKSGGKDQEVFAKAIDDADPGIPLLCACQQLCTMAAIMRGLDDAAAHVVAADSASNMSVWAAEYPARLESADDWRRSKYAIEHGLEPCSAYVAPVPLKGGGVFPHIAVVIRVFRSNTFQFVDTGALRTEGIGPKPGDPEIYPNPFLYGPQGAASGGGNYDTGARTAVRSGFYKSLGIAPRVSDDKLRTAIDRTRRSRPLGFARLVILNRDGADPTDNDLESRLRWATPLLPMWESSDPKKNYPLARYLWSLREHPYRDAFEVRWLFYIPQDLLVGGKWVHLMMTSVCASRAFRWDATMANSLPAEVGIPVLTLASATNGSTRIVGRFAASPFGWQDCLHRNPNYDPKDPKTAQYLATQPAAIKTMPIGAQPAELNVLHRIAGATNAMTTTAAMSTGIPAYLRGDN